VVGTNHRWLVCLGGVGMTPESDKPFNPDHEEGFSAFVTRPIPPTYEELRAGLDHIADIVKPHLNIGRLVSDDSEEGFHVEDAGIPQSGPDVYALASAIFSAYVDAVNPTGYDGDMI
jgi:hypothetical protein